MFWKEYNFNFKKYCKYLIFIIIILTIVSKMTQSNEQISDSTDLNVVLLKNDEIAKTFILDISDDIQINYVSYIEGDNKFQNNEDVFVNYNMNTNCLDVIINPDSSDTEVIGTIFQQSQNRSEFDLKVLENPNSKKDDTINIYLKDQLNMLLAVISIAFILIAYNLFVSEKKVLPTIVYSPEKNNNIIHSKMLLLIFMNLVVCLYLFFANSIHYKLILIIFLIIQLYSLFGLIFGVMYNQKKFSGIFWFLVLGLNIGQLYYIKSINLTNVINYLHKTFQFLLVIVIQIFILIVGYILLLKLLKYSFECERKGI